jgi:hypothetical protein
MNISSVDRKSDRPTRPEKLIVDFNEQFDSLAIVKRGSVDSPDGCALLFISVWLIGWTLVCALLVFKVVTEPSLKVFAFAVPFCASWIAVVCLMAWRIFGKETLFLGRDEAIFQKKAIIRLSSRVVPREEVRGFREYATVSRGRHNREVKYSGIEILTLGKPVQFGLGLPEEERAWLIDQLNRFLEKHEVKAERHLSALAMITEDTLPSIDPPSANGPATVIEVLTFERTLANPPADCDWHITESDDGFAFGQRGRLNFSNLVTGLLFNGFLNGLVLVFLLVLFGIVPNNKVIQAREWWTVFFVLIPFEVVGSIAFALLILTVIEPFRCTSWRLGRDRIANRSGWPMYSHTRTWDVLGRIRLELRRNFKNQQDGYIFRTLVGVVEAMKNPNGYSPFELVLVSNDNVDLCKIGYLTEGEARWLARLILERHPEWVR